MNQSLQQKGVVLVRPPMLVPTLTFSGLTVPPIGLAYVAAHLRRHGHDVTLVDAVGEATSQYERHHDDYVLHGLNFEQMAARIPAGTFVIGVSCMFSHEFPIYRDLMAKLRERFPAAKIVAGGEHVTALPKITLAQCPGLDVLVLGEGEETFTELVECDFSDEALEKMSGIAWRRGGEIVFNPRRARVKNIDSFPRPAWDLVPLENYWRDGAGLGVDLGRSMPILATRGCPYQCTFCSSPLMWTTRWTARAPLEVVEEMKHYVDKYGINNFDFYDLTAIVHKKWIVEFCGLILQHGLNITYQLPTGTRSEAIDREVAGLLYKTGCRNMTYAPESGSKRVLTAIKKRVKISGMLDSMRACVDEKLNIKVNLIVGFPGETWSDLLATYGFLFRMAAVGVHDVTIQPYSAYPGTELFDSLHSAKKIELNDEFYYALANLADLAKSSSWSEHLSARVTFWFRTIGMMSFYAASFGLRPWRLYRTLKNLLAGKQESRLERALQDLFRRKRTLNQLGAAATNPVVCPPYV